VPAEIYASSTDDSRISMLLKEKAEARRDNRPADNPRSEGAVQRELESARSHEQVVFAFIWIVVSLGGAFARDRSLATARRLFFFSILYLPLLLLVLVIDRLWLQQP